MKIEISPLLESRPELKELARKAEPVVLQICQRFDKTATAHWSLDKTSNGYDLVTLELADLYGGYASAAFAPDELANESQIYRRIHDLVPQLIGAEEQNSDS